MSSRRRMASNDTEQVSVRLREVQHVTRKRTSRAGQMSFGGWVGRRSPVPHTLRAEATGYSSMTSTVQLRPRSMANITVHLTPRSSQLQAVAAAAPQPCSHAPSHLQPACAAALLLNGRWLEERLGQWRDTQFWGSGNAVQALADYTLRSGDTQFVPVIRAVFKARGTAAIELLGAGSYDDMQWWSLAYANAGLVLNDTSMVATASKIFTHVLEKASDNSTCSGGVFWSDKRSYHLRVSITTIRAPD
jgi:hypothetical protein